MRPSGGREGKEKGKGRVKKREEREEEKGERNQGGEGRGCPQSQNRARADALVAMMLEKLRLTPWFVDDEGKSNAKFQNDSSTGVTYTPFTVSASKQHVRDLQIEISP